MRDIDALGDLRVLADRVQVLNHLVLEILAGILAELVLEDVLVSLPQHIDRLVEFRLDYLVLVLDLLLRQDTVVDAHAEPVLLQKPCVCEIHVHEHVFACLVDMFSLLPCGYYTKIIVSLKGEGRIYHQNAPLTKNC